MTKTDRKEIGSHLRMIKKKKKKKTLTASLAGESGATALTFANGVRSASTVFDPLPDCDVCAVVDDEDSP